MELLPEALGAFDSRKRAMVKQIAELLASPKDKLTQMLAGIAEDTKALPNAQDAAMSVMPEVAAQGRKEMQDAGVNAAGMFVGPRAKLGPDSHKLLLRAQELDHLGIGNE